jgi:hypothetical protein
MNSIPSWPLGPFHKLADANPVLGSGNGRFPCPFLGRVTWEDRGICNPAAAEKSKMTKKG